MTQRPLDPPAMCTCGHLALLHDQRGCLGWVVGTRPATTTDYKAPGVVCTECPCMAVRTKGEPARKQRDLLLR